ncbi:MAG: hypothetical protein HQ511_07215 [Rhodospirillales bacterium]|nr:hypothetical protein [Rhodospirillales bacterium]
MHAEHPAPHGDPSAAQGSGPDGDYTKGYGAALTALNGLLGDLTLSGELSASKLNPEDNCPEDEDDKYKIGDDYPLVPPTAFRLGQDSNIWCQHQPGAPATVPFYFGPTGPSIVDDDDFDGLGGPSISAPGGPASVYQPPGGLSTVPQEDPRYNMSTPQGYAPFAYGFPTIPSSCSGSECPSGGLFSTPSILDQLDSCYGSDCPQTTYDQDEDDTDTSQPTQQPSTTPELPSYFSTTTGVKIELSVVLDAAGSQQSVAGQSLKITGMDFGLPPDCTSGCDESTKTDVASNLGPSQCTTGSDGRCTIDVSPCEFGSSAQCGAASSPYYVGVNAPEPRFNETGVKPQTGLQDYTIPVNLVSTPMASSIGAVQGTPTGCSLGGSLCDAVTDQFTVGDYTHYVFTYPAADEQSYLNTIGQDPNIEYVEINYCDEKKLPAPKAW